MHSVINFVQRENRVISATYRHLMIRAKVVLVDKESGAELAEPVITITSPVPSGVLRIRLPDSIAGGVYYLKALNAYGEYLARSADFVID
jgi:hypothetical protein